MKVSAKSEGDESGETVKLRGNPKALNYQVNWGNSLMARVMTSGMVKTLEMMDNGQSAAKS